MVRLVIQAQNLNLCLLVLPHPILAFIHPLLSQAMDNGTRVPLPLRDDSQASERNKTSQEYRLWSQKDLVIVIIIVAALVTTIILFSPFHFQDFPGLYQWL